TDTMTYSGTNDVYTGIILKQTGGTTIHYVIEVIDDDSESVRSEENSFIFNTAGNESPQITGVDFSPNSPESDDVVTVSATITDSDGNIETAEIHWGTSAGAYVNSVPLSGTGDNYSGQIAAQDDGTHVYFVIYAADEVGGSAQSEEYDYIVEDVNLLPEITDVIYDPTDPESTENVRVSAIITDSDGSIATAKVKYGISTGSYTNEVSMTGSENSYIGEIPAQVDGTTIYFLVEAIDNESGVAVSVESSYTVSDPVNEAPVISEVLHSPSSPNEDENVVISCSATDPDGPDDEISVMLRWKKGSGDYTSITMNLSGGKYYGQIPMQSAGETINFSIIAEDNQGLQSTYNDSYEISESIGINKLDRNSINIYPNPTNNKVTVEINQTQLIKSIDIYNLVGEKVLNISGLNDIKYTIELSSLPKGMYIVKVNDQESSFVRRIILK
ncbi:T9SS type A sorting domain-containing protein, partial [Bacteroidota bacterium]